MVHGGYKLICKTELDVALVHPQVGLGLVFEKLGRLGWVNVSIQSWVGLGWV